MVSMVVVMTSAVSIPLGDSLSLNLILLFLSHPLDLPFKEFHLIGVSFSDLIFLPFLVFPAFLYPLPIDIETIQFLLELQFVIKVKLTIVFFV
jgi:hypothetical protein